MTHKHTPGPWEPKFSFGCCIGVGTSGSYSQMICNTILPDTEEDYNKNESQIIADARLIAAAPELLEALESLCLFFEDFVDPILYPQSYRNAKEIIKKATSCA